MMPTIPLNTGMSPVLFYFGYTLKRSARLIGYFILDFYYWCNNGTKRKTQQCNVEWSTAIPRPAIISSKLRRLRA
ncbi:hypothetical protein BLA51_09380 [Yersinia pseudotuberculosis]|nr:hypothetical protein BLA52_01355 [Yersinia pseudotuberculosis]PSH27231.1 hypothetical protein BLA50_04705 [Yersinia pseudotuberculosis]PSH30779.1 hypothetical protein BLA51_09380 [Yersinia pseudotuberculosis]PSH35013.1 hypothetical protein BA197_11615 [Yersinia pseudotuberculosis]